MALEHPHEYLTDGMALRAWLACFEAQASSCWAILKVSFK